MSHSMKKKQQKKTKKKKTIPSECASSEDSYQPMQF